MVKKAKNTYLEICRFLAAVTVMLHHTDVIGLQKIAPGGWIFVEFYFVISGFFVTRHFDNEKMNDNIEKEALLYTINKLKNVIPYAYVGIFIGAFNQIINNRDSFSTICEVLLSLPANLLFLGGLGIARYNLMKKIGINS